jgi:type II secretion system protein H
MRGFTLLELLIAVAIIAIVSSTLVVKAWPDAAASADSEARRLAALLESAIAEARTSGKAIAWSPEGSGYAFWRRNLEGTWERFPEDSVYGPRLLASGAALRSERAVLVPYGMAGSIQAAISGGETTIIIRSGALGRISLERIHAD